MADKLDLLIGKIEALLQRVESTSAENKVLKTENRQLRSELDKTHKRYDRIGVQSADHSATVKSKLAGILDRLEQLEELGA